MFFRLNREVETLFDNLNWLHSRVSNLYRMVGDDLTISIPVEGTCSQEHSSKEVALKDVVQALIDHLGVDVTVQTGTRIQVRDKEPDSKQEQK